MDQEKWHLVIRITIAIPTSDRVRYNTTSFFPCVFRVLAEASDSNCPVLVKKARLCLEIRTAAHLYLSDNRSINHGIKFWFNVIAEYE